MNRPSLVTNWRLFPLKREEKIPLERWANDQVFDLEDERYASLTSYGVDTGRSGLVVIDCDVKEGCDGVTLFLEKALELGGEMPTTYSVNTPNGGLHFYYQAPPTVTISSSVGTVMGPGIDVRAQGGYVVGPGSTIRTREGGLGTYEPVSADDAVEELPGWLLGLLLSEEEKKKAAKAKAPKGAPPDEAPPASGRRAAEEIEQTLALEWALKHMRETGEGKRAITLNSLSYFMGCKRVQRSEAHRLVEAAALQGLPSDEAEKIFLKGYQDGLQQEVQAFDYIVKEYNSGAGLSGLEDPYAVEAYSDAGFSLSFWKKHCSNIIYWITDERWYVYDEEKGTWEITPEVDIKAAIKNHCQALVEDIRKSNAKLTIEVYKRQDRVYTNTAIESITSMARKDFLHRDRDLFDQHPYLVNVKNGVFDLRSGTLIPHDKTLYLTHHIPVKYVEGAQDVYCTKILESAHPEELEFLQLFAGQSLIGTTPISQAAFFLFGRGANGKSTFIDLMLKTGGTYSALQAPSILTLEKGKENYALADLEGLRCAIVEELPEAKTLNVGALKRITGTSRITARAIYKEHHSFENKATIFVSCNRLPLVNETDYGTWRRVLVFTFPYTYYKSKAQITDPSWDRVGDPKVMFAAQRLEKTAEAFLAWRIEGALRWYRNNQLEYRVPATVEEATREWNENNDLILSWFTSEIETNPNTLVTMQDLADSYNIWAKQRNQASISLRTFSEMLRNHHVIKSRGKSILYKKGATFLTLLNRSAFVNKETGEITDPTATRSTYLTGLCFKNGVTLER